MILRTLLKIVLLSSLFFCLFACNRKGQQTVISETENVSIPTFNPDSAYLYVKTQVDFGPRTPNSEAHRKCGDYLIAQMKQWADSVYVQKVDLTRFDGEILHARNIIAAFNPEEKSRILLLAHWDCRPWSDYDPNPNNHKKPVDGANDGASGIGVLMEIARLIHSQNLSIGVDIFFTDAEDSGEPRWISGGGNEKSWCLGAQYWAQKPHVAGYNARFGILLDMVGDANAVFPKEGYSIKYAPHIVEIVWSEAHTLGFANYFENKMGSYITDDHVPINQITNIPTIDIVHYTEQGFATSWHTQTDNMQHISKNTLRIVGQTVLNVLYKEEK